MLVRADPAAFLDARAGWYRPAFTRAILSWTMADVDQDGAEDLWVEYRVTDLGGLSPQATEVGLYGTGAGLEALATLGIGRLSSASDADSDGIQNACDACDDTPAGATRGPDGCPWP